MAEEALIAVFIDFENLAIGARDMGGNAEFDIDIVLRRLLEKGRVVVKRAYCDWSRYRKAEKEFHLHAIEMLDIPHTKVSGKNSADIRMVVDALDLCYSKDHIDMFALITGDSDFSPLVSKLKENHKRVIGCGIKNSTSNLLISNCDEFIYYDDLAAAKRKAPSTRKRTASKKADPKAEALDQLLEITRSLVKEYDPLWGSIIKQTIRRVYPGFNESFYGYESFADLLEDAEDRKLLRLDYDEGRGNFMVRLPAEAS